MPVSPLFRSLPFRPVFRRTALLLACLALLAPRGDLTHANGAGAEMTVSGRVTHDFARISFASARANYVNATARGKSVTVTFEHPAEIDTRALTGRLSPYVTAARLSADRRTLSLTLDQPYRVRSFVSEKISGIDILGIDPEAAALAQENSAPKPAVKYVSRAPEKPPEKIPEKKEPPKKTAKTAKPERKSTAAENAAAAQAKLSPAAGNEEPEAKPAAPAEAAPEPEKTAQAEPPAEAAPSAGAAEPAEPAAEQKTAESPAPPAPPTPTAATPAPQPSEPPAPAPVQPGAVPVYAGTAGGQYVLRFAWPERVAAAVFARGRTLWIVFNRRTEMNFNAVRENALPLMQMLSSVPHPKATILRVSMPDGAGAIVSRATDSLEWQVTLSSAPPPPAGIIPVETNTQPPLPPHVRLALLEGDEPLEVTDPDLGDRLIVIPVYSSALGIAPARRFVEFALLETAQGAVVQPIADGVRLAQTRNGFRLSTEGGASLTENAPPVTAAATTIAGSLKTPRISLFPYGEWKRAESISFVEARLKILEQMNDNPTQEDALALRLKLAQLYLSEGMQAEALGVLQEIKRLNSGFYVSNRLSAMEGAANFLLHRFSEAARSFAAPELANTPEVEFWRSVVADLLGASGQQYDYLGNNDKFIRTYPPLFRERLAVVAADRAISQEDYGAAISILETLRAENLLDEIEDYSGYLIAKVAVETGETAEGLNRLQEISEDYSSPFVRARAEFERISAQLKLKQMPMEEALARLERLRLSWRGDAIEMNTLALLGTLYAQQEDYLNALRSWRDIIASFANTTTASTAIAKMKALYVELFEEGGISRLAPLDQLALYYEYRDLTPSDDAGNRIVEKIAERMVALDLLDQAASLLDKRIRYAYDKEERSRAGAQLARIHLWNRNPQKALAALDASVYGDNPPDLRSQRDRLAAEAMIRLSRFEEAVRLIERDKSAEAAELRLRAMWVQKDWPKVAEAAEESLKNRTSPTAALTEREIDTLLMLAIAYAQEEDRAQLQYLRDYFTPLLKDHPRAPLFAFITRPDVPVTPRDFARVIKDLEESRTFLAEYKIRGGTEPAQAAATP